MLKSAFQITCTGGEGYVICVISLRRLSPMLQVCDMCVACVACVPKFFACLWTWVDLQLDVFACRRGFIEAIRQCRMVSFQMTPAYPDICDALEIS